MFEKFDAQKDLVISGVQQGYTQVEMFERLFGEDEECNLDSFQKWAWLNCISMYEPKKLCLTCRSQGEVLMSNGKKLKYCKKTGKQIGRKLPMWCPKRRSI